MARRRRGSSVKTVRQTRSLKKSGKVNGLPPSTDSILEESSLGEPENCKATNHVSSCMSSVENCTEREPVVHHKKFGKIRMSGQNENSMDYGRFESKLESSDENDSESLENTRYGSDASIRGMESTVSAKSQNSYVDFRNQSSVYKVENDIPLDGSVIIKPGTFSSNTITSSVKSNIFFDATTTSDLNSVNFLKVLQGIEMLERNVSGSLEFDDSEPKGEKGFLMNSSPPSRPAYSSEESECKGLFKEEMVQLNCVKTEREDLNEIKLEDSLRGSNVSSPEDTSSDAQNEAEDTARKLQGMVLDERRETSGSPASKTSDEIHEKKIPGPRSRTGSTDTAGSESSSNCGATIRRSNRIKSIGIMKQKEREQAAVKTETAIKSPLPPGSPVVTPPVPGYDDKPVKVKSRWRRSSELEMHGGKAADSESVSSSCPSPINLPPSSSSGCLEPTPEDLEKLEKEKKDIEEGLKTFTILTENEYKMERSACKETKRMICDCALTKEEISRGEVGCGEDCLNRMLFLECGSRCALGERCTNKRFQKLQYANCKIFKTEKKGFGLKAEEDLPGNTFIMEYVGEVVDQREFTRRVKMYAKENNKHFYFMALKGDAIIDATNKGNVSRFINHSCDPNAETQKWTINGELRVGFFTRRFVAAGEEITFDYQFQRYGKQAQKCYCEASNCRGWIGENPDESCEEDEEEEEEEDEEDEEEDEEEGEEEEESKKEIRKPDREKKGEVVKLHQPIARKVRREKKSVQRKRRERKTTIVDDMGLDEEIQKLFQTGLKNRAHTLTLSRLMIRAEDWSTRGKLLKLIREGETPCRRLFLDYHGLRLICSWMLSRELEESTDKNERRLEILKTLSKLPIPNKNMLLDSKILSVVEQWAKSGFPVRKLSIDEEGANEEQKKSEREEAIPGLGGEIEDGLRLSTEERETIDTLKKKEKEMEATDSAIKVKELAEGVLESWSLLKEVFKIPKKERIEQMKEHERQADRGYSEYLDNKENFRDKYERHDRYGRSDRYRDRDRDRMRDRKRARESPPDPDWLKNHERVSKMSKHERRQLFALKVLQEDEEAKKRNEHLEMWKQHESRCLALGLDPNLNAACDPQTGFPIFFDHGTGTWQSCPPSAGPSPLPHSVTPTICTSPMYQVNPTSCPNCPMCTNLSVCSNLNNSICHNGMMANGIAMNNGPVQGYPLTPYQGGVPQANFDGLEASYQEFVPSDAVQLPYEENPRTEIDQPVITEAPLNVPIKLPPKWKAVKDSKGRYYFYHVKERISQWEPPQWTEEDAKIEAAKTVALEMGEESSSSSESSTESSSDEEDETETIEGGNEAKLSENCEETKEETLIESNVHEGVNENALGSPKEDAKLGMFEDDKDEDLSAWEDEDDLGKAPKTVSKDKIVAPEDNKSAMLPVPASAPPPSTTKVRRAGLVQEILISPRREEDRVDNRKFKEVKEMLRRQKEESRIKEKMRIKGEKMSVRPSKSKKKRKEKIGRGSRTKGDKFSGVTTATTESSTDRKIKENFKNSMAGAIVSHLNPYRKQDCKIGRITCNEDFKHLARKLTHFVMLKELKHCRGVDDLECNDSVKAKAKDFIRKYMAKFGAVYQRPQHEVWKT